MTESPTPSPIVVNANPAQDSIEAGLRQVILAAAAIAMALGYVGAAGKISGLLLAAGPIAGLIVFVIGQVKTYSQAHKAAIMANALPDATAHTKAGWIKGR